MQSSTQSPREYKTRHRSTLCRSAVQKIQALDFFECDSGSDSDENEVKAFNETEDSSGSDSDTTVIPALNQTANDARASASGPSTAEEATREVEADTEPRWLRALATLPEDEVPNDRFDTPIGSPVVDDRTESHVGVVSTDTQVASADLQIASIIEGSTDAPTSTTGTPLPSTSTPAKPKKRRRKLPTANAVSLEQETEHRTFQKPEREMVPEISPSVYMQEAWESTSSRATSVMSANTRNVIAGLMSIGGRKFDQGHRLLEWYCSKGNAAAVRCLLEFKCNPGTKTHRWPGPILKAVKGASARHNKCVQALIEHDVDVNVKDKRNGLEKQSMPGAFQTPQL